MRICILTGFEDLMLKDSGASVRILSLARGLVALGNEVCIIIPKNEETRDYYDGVLVRGLRGFCPSTILRILSKLLGVSRPTSLYFYDLLFILKVLRIGRKYDIVQIEHQVVGGILCPIMARIAEKPLFIDCHDVFQALRVQHTSTLRKLIETFLEKIAYKFADVILTVSEAEKNLLFSSGIRRKENIAVVANGVDTRAFRQKQEKLKVGDAQDLTSATSSKPKVIFVGNMGYLPNREAVEMIATEIAPQVRKEVENITFIIVGRNPEKIALPGITFMGVVDNVARVLNSADVAIAPLRQGSGTRLKVLEYFSSGLPVVSTSVGVEGLEVKNGLNVLIEDDIHQLSSKIVKLLTDKTLAVRLGSAARELVIQKYDWMKIVFKLNNLYVDQIRKRGEK